MVQNMVMHRIARILGEGHIQRNCDSSRAKSSGNLGPRSLQLVRPIEATKSRSVGVN